MKLRSLISLCLAGASITAMAQGYKDGIEYYKADQFKNAKELLSVKPQSEAVLGYEIMSTLNSREKNLSLGYYNSFINVGGRRDVTPYLYALPYFEVASRAARTVLPV